MVFSLHDVLPMSLKQGHNIFVLEVIRWLMHTCTLCNRHGGCRTQANKAGAIEALMKQSIFNLNGSLAI